MTQPSRYKELYLNWIVRKVPYPLSKSEKEYSMLFEALDSVPFEVPEDIPMDANRLADGYSLRHKFAYENGIEYDDIDSALNDIPASILEVLVALAIRAEDTITTNADYGDRTNLWFWDMMTNMGLMPYDDANFNSYEVNDILDCFLNREYDPDGKGGPFWIDGRDNMPYTELWYQMQWYSKKYL